MGAVQRTGEVCSDAVTTQTLTSSGSDVALSTLSSFCKALAGKREGVGGSRGEEWVGPEGRSGWVQRGGVGGSRGGVKGQDQGKHRGTHQTRSSLFLH